jgi:hypothetical protein
MKSRTTKTTKLVYVRWLDSSITQGETCLPEYAAGIMENEKAQLVPVGLRAQAWHSQSRFDQGRRKFHWEHVDPISCIQEACAGAGSEEAVLELLRARLRIAWITKQEDHELRRLGFRSARPDPEEAYRAAGIVLVRP